MRLQLTALALLVAVAAQAGDRASTRVDVYSDEWVTVVVPSARGSIDREKVAVEGGWMVDAVTGATAVLGADVVSTATTFDDLRHQADLAVTARPKGTWSLGAAYTGSFESDYLTHAPSVSFGTPLFDDMATVSVRYTSSFETVSADEGDPLVERTVAHALDLGWTQILDRLTTGAIALSGGWADCGDVLGCQASPYRWIPFEDDDKVVRLAAHERHPSTRGRVAASIRLARRLGPVAVHADSRVYADTWGVLAHTERLAVAGELLDERLLLRAEGRWAQQTPATFFRETYATADPMAATAYRTADAELCGVRDLQLSGRAEWSFYGVGPFVRLGASARVARLWYRYPEVDLRPERNAWIVGGGLDGEL